MNLDRILSATKRIKNVSDKLDAVKALFKLSPDYVNPDSLVVSGIKMDTIVDNDKVAIIHVFYDKVGESLPIHAHQDSLEYLISIKGKHLLKFPEGSIRIIEQGDCATISTGIDHTTVSLTPKAELLAVCIPPEMAYRKVEDGHN